MHKINSSNSPANQATIEHSYKRQVVFFSLIIGVFTCLSIASYIFQSRISNKQEDYAKIINLSGRQRMLSQNIVARVVAHRNEVIADTHIQQDLVELKNAFETFQVNHLRFFLDPSNPESLANLNTKTTTEIYNREHKKLLLFMEHIKQFIAAAEQENLHTQRNESILSEHANIIAQLGLGPVLDMMDSLAFERTKQANILLKNVKQSQLITFILFLIILILLAMFIFTTEVKRQKNAMIQLLDFHEKEKKLYAFSALGEVSAKIVHEINNPLSAVMGRLEILLKNKNNMFDEKTLKTFESMKLSLGRISKIIRLTKIVYRKSDNDALNIFDLAHIVSDIVETTQLLKGKEEVKFKCKVEEGHFIKAQEHQIYQVINNIVNNAIDATLNQEERVVHVELLGDERRAILRISDNGSGVPVDLENKIFEKLFTTKATGTGIGLFESKGIVESYGGSIKLAPEISRSCFEISMPLES